MYKYWTVIIAFCLSVAYATALFAQESEASFHKKVFSEWGLDEKFVTADCIKGLTSEPCKNKDHVFNWIAESLSKAPSFLKKVHLFMIMFSERAEGSHLDGEAEASFSAIEIKAKIDEPIDFLVVHELAHLYQEKTNPTTVDEYLNIRYQSVWSSVDKVWKYVDTLNPQADRFTPKSQLKYDAKVTQMLEAIPVPHRTPYDLHASEDDYEYWATSVELYYKYGRTEKQELKKHLSDKEIAFLQKLFGY